MWCRSLKFRNQFIFWMFGKNSIEVLVMCIKVIVFDIFMLYNECRKYLPLNDDLSDYDILFGRSSVTRQTLFPELLSRTRHFDI